MIIYHTIVCTFLHTSRIVVGTRDTTMVKERLTLVVKCMCVSHDGFESFDFCIDASSDTMGIHMPLLLAG